MGYALKAIRRAQRRWAHRHGIEFDERDHARDVDMNLFQPLTTDSHAELTRGAGNELERKMRSLISSSALVANVVDPLRAAGKASALMDALGFEPAAACKVNGLEAAHPTGAGGPSAHLDWEMGPTGEGLAVGVESKFTEPYQTSERAKPKDLSRAYLAPQMARRWDAFPRARDLAQRIVDGDEPFRRLDAPQLLKHMLGLHGAYGDGGFVLALVWYEATEALAESSAEAKAIEAEVAAMRAEITRFQDQLDSGLSFRALTWQELFGSLEGAGQLGGAHRRYLRDRYFA